VDYQAVSIEALPPPPPGFRLAGVEVKLLLERLPGGGGA
jgi:hypothetical protein